MTSQEIDLLANRLYTAFGYSIGLNIEKIRKCVLAIAELNDREIEDKLRKLLS